MNRLYLPLLTLLMLAGPAASASLLTVNTVNPGVLTVGGMLSPESVTNADGTLRLDGVRGRVDLRGWRVVLGEADVPHLIPARGASVPEVAALATWSALGSGVDNTIRALAFDGSGNLYAGGFFTTAGSNAANRVAKWDGANWSALGTGVNNTVEALALDSSGNLYAGGEFTTADGNAASRIAKWDGANWSALGTGVNNTVEVLAFDGSGNLYAGGRFTTAGSNAASYVAKWDGANWSALGTGVNSFVWALALDGSGNLYAGGFLTTAGGNAANRVAKWDGANWSALGSGVDNTVYTLALDGSGNLYAGGFFTTAGGNAANRIAKWDGANWSALGSGTNGQVEALDFDGSGNLYAVGIFDTAGGNTVNGVAKWDGANWSALGNGMNSIVHSVVYDGSTNLYAGGVFNIADNNSANRVALWDDASAPLPVELTAFSAITEGKTVTLNWQTASETNNAGFYVEIERKAEWVAMGFVGGHGTTQHAQSYTYTVEYLTPGTHRFRLKQIDFDGQFEYSPVVEATVEVPGSYYFSSAYPNPFVETTRLEFAVKREQEVALALYNVQGQLVEVLYQGVVPAGTVQHIEVTGTGLPSGVYVARLVGSNFTESRRLVLSK